LWSRAITPCFPGCLAAVFRRPAVPVRCFFARPHCNPPFSFSPIWSPVFLRIQTLHSPCTLLSSGVLSPVSRHIRIASPTFLPELRILFFRAFSLNPFSWIPAGRPRYVESQDRPPGPEFFRCHTGTCSFPVRLLYGPRAAP